MAQKTAVLLDTDIGSDIDDALALSYLLKQPQCELAGVTTVSGDVQKRAALVEIVCHAAGRKDVPIHCGRRDVLAFGPGQPNVPQYDTVKDRPHRLDRPENTAVEFLRQAIRKRPGEIVLLSIGPFSNIAALFAVDPEIPKLCKSIVSMAGVFFAPGSREWNAICDPVSTSIVYATPRPQHLSVGLDVTEKCRMHASDLRPKFAREPLATVAKLAESWFEHSSDITFHDPLAAAMIFHPGLCEVRKGRVEVPVTGDPDKSGATVFTEGAGNDEVAATVSPDAFFEEFFSVCH
ncbi:MAG TPA: nucleoside hydrolase [Fimbriimonadaceae bacterium]|nr:nucleoside hydrolase [Fimbriimonadaceae bacterium]